MSIPKLDLTKAEAIKIAYGFLSHQSTMLNLYGGYPGSLTVVYDKIVQLITSNGEKYDAADLSIMDKSEALKNADDFLEDTDSFLDFLSYNDDDIDLEEFEKLDQESQRLIKESWLMRIYEENPERFGISIRDLTDYLLDTSHHIGSGSCNE